MYLCMYMGWFMYVGVPMIRLGHEDRYFEYSLSYPADKNTGIKRSRSWGFEPTIYSSGRRGVPPELGLTFPTLDRDFYGSLKISIDSSRFPWPAQDFHGRLKISMIGSRFLWPVQDFYLW
jgi:hypothetical protein